MTEPERSIETLFHLARQKSSTRERAAFLDGACGEDKDLRRRVIELLEADEEAGEFLAVETPDEEGPGTVIDRYKLLQKIGEGGFGAVYMAEQTEPVKRKVALKVIKLGMDTGRVIARFEAERQALAMMDHPNIAKVFDAGTTEKGRPYFVMELVKGVPITDYCDTENLGTRGRLELFIAVCHAIQHAHQKGIIHRDIKPSNVLVTLHDGVPVPKVIDFGIAKATNVELTQKTLFTEFRQFIGTAEYMSPEQAEMSGLDIDSRSDVYALGVLLYELLTGTTPLLPETLRRAGLGEIQRLIREEEPPKPSTRLSSLEGTTPVARHRRSDPKALTRQLRGDIDWIVMKALEKDRTRRYDTATGLSRDIERHLKHEAVEAGPPSNVYRLRKFARRNRAGVLAGGIAGLALLVGLALATAGFVHARHEAESTHAVADFYERMFTSLVPYQVGKVGIRREAPGPAGFTELTVADLLRRAQPGIESAFAGRPELEADIRRTFGWTLAGLGLGEEALLQLQHAREVQIASVGSNHPEVLRTVSLLAFTHFLRGRPQEAVEIIRPNLLAHTRRHGRDHPLTLQCQRFLAHMLWTSGELEEAEVLARDAVERAGRSLGHEHGITLWARHTLAVTIQSRGRLEEADAMLREIGESASRVVPNNALCALVPAMRAIGLCELERFDEAESWIAAAIETTTRRFGERHPFLPHLRCLAVLIRAEQGDSVAEEKLGEIGASQRERIGMEHFMTAFTETQRARLLIERGRYAEAEEIARILPGAVRVSCGDRGTSYLQARSLLGRAMMEQGQLVEAGRILEAAVRDAESMLPGGFLEMPEIRSAYGRCLDRLGRRDEAESQLLRAYESLAKMRGALHQETRACAAEIAALYDASNEPEKARAWLSK